MRWIRVLAFPVLMGLLVACGGGDDEGGDGGGSDSGDASNGTAAATSESGGGGGNNGGAGGNGLEGDVDEIAERLTPPNATETSRFSTSDGLVLGFESSDSVDDLKEHYDNEIGDAGYPLLGTQSAGGTYAWFLGNENGSGFGASVGVSPSSDAGSIVAITVSRTGVEAGGGTSSGGGEATPASGGDAEDDIDELIDRLTPPNSSETSRFSSSDGVVISWESSDSVESIKGFYDSAIEEAGLNVYGTQSAADTHSWVIAEDSGNGYSGSVTIGPSGSGGTGVSALLGFTQ